MLALQHLLLVVVVVETYRFALSCSLLPLHKGLKGFLVHKVHLDSLGSPCLGWTLQTFLRHRSLPVANTTATSSSSSVDKVAP